MVRFLAVALDWVFPMRERRTPAKREALEKACDDDRMRIAAISFEPDTDVALDEARRIYDFEAERRKSADQKATTYLTLVSALVPLILTIAMAVWDKKAGPAPTAVNMAILAGAVVYVTMAGWWSFRVLKVAASSRIGISDAEAAWKKPKPAIHVAQSILACARLNQDGVNDKVTGIKMAHAFLIHAFFTFATLLLLNIIWFLAAAFWESRRAAPDPWLASAETGIRAVIEVEALQDEIQLNSSATTVLQSWCAKHDMAPDQSIKADKIASRPVPLSAAQAQLLRTAPSDKIVFRQVRLRCGTRALSQARLWYVPSRLPATINKQLTLTDVPFGRAIAPLKFTRRSIGSTSYWPALKSGASGVIPEILFQEQALLTLPGDIPVAIVVEDYRRDVLAFDPQHR